MYQKHTEHRISEPENPAGGGTDVDLDRMERAYRDAFHNAVSGYCNLEVFRDPETGKADIRYLEMNRAFVLQTGLSRKETTGARAREIFEEDESLEEILEQYARVAETGNDLVREIYFTPLQKWFNLAAWKSGERQVTLSLWDITDQRTAQAAATRERDNYRRIFLDHSAVKLIIDPDTGTIVEANHAAAAFYGWPKEVLETKSIYELNASDPDTIREAIGNVLAEDRDRLEFVHRRADGTKRDVEIFSSPVTYEGKRRLHSIIVDITDRKKAERKLAEREAELQRLLQEKETLVQEVHHRIKNDMQFIRGMLFLQAEDSKDEGARESLNDASNRVGVLSSLYRRLYGGEATEARVVQADELLRDLADDMRETTLSEKIELQVDSEELALCTKQAVNLAIIVNELVTNAIKHGAGAAHAISVSLTVERDYELHLEIRDNGSGYPEAVLRNGAYGSGLTFVAELAAQQRGELALGNDGGGVALVTLPIQNRE